MYVTLHSNSVMKQLSTYIQAKIATASVKSMNTASMSKPVYIILRNQVWLHQTNDCQCE